MFSSFISVVILYLYVRHGYFFVTFPSSIRNAKGIFKGISASSLTHLRLEFDKRQDEKTGHILMSFESTAVINTRHLEVIT